jgi:hypothetical protein
MNSTYAKAYTEVLEILNHLSIKEYNRIPKEKIEEFSKYKDKNYKFVFDENLPINKQNISKEVNAIIITLFREYFATDEQKIKLQKILYLNEVRKQKI